MRDTNGAFLRYVKGTSVPKDAKDLAAFMEAELSNIQASFNELAEGHLDLITVAPTKPREGMMRFAEAGVLGVNKGFYGYHSSAWSFLG